MSYPDDGVYCRWGGNPKGVKEDTTRCIEEVWPQDRGTWLPHQCGRRRGHGPDGRFCKQHAKKYREDVT